MQKNKSMNVARMKVMSVSSLCYVTLLVFVFLSSRSEGAFTTTTKPSTPTRNIPFSKIHRTRQPKLSLGFDPSQIADTLSSSGDFSTVLASNAQLLADAAAAVASDATDEGWWAGYLNLFKGGMELIHSGIDKPLRDVGFDQTWGVSIALFTMGKFLLDGSDRCLFSFLRKGLISCRKNILIQMC